MQKFILVLMLCCTALSVQAQQVVGSGQTTKKASEEAINRMRYQHVQNSINELSESIATAVSEQAEKTAEDISAVDTKYQQLLQGPNGNDGLLNKVNELEALVRKIASCKATVVDGCALPVIPLESTGFGSCQTGFVGTGCTAKCDVEKGLEVISTSCRLPRACSGGSTTIYQGGGFGIPGTPYTATLANTQSGGTYTTSCEVNTGCYFGATGTNKRTYSSCSFKCNDGTWSLTSATGETIISQCQAPSYNFGGINLGF